MILDIYPHHPDVDLPVFSRSQTLLTTKKEYHGTSIKADRKSRAQRTFIRMIGVDVSSKYENLTEAIKAAEEEFGLAAAAVGGRVIEHLFGLYPKPQSLHMRAGVDIPTGFIVAAEVGIVDPTDTLPPAGLDTKLEKYYTGRLTDMDSTDFLKGSIRTDPALAPQLWLVDIDLYIA